MNVLSARLDKAARDKPFGYHPLCKKISLTHLSFVEGTKNLDKGVITVFDKSAVGLGLKISLEKSTIYMAGEPQATMDAILANFPFERGALHVRYLRLTLMTKSIYAEKRLSSLGRVISTRFQHGQAGNCLMQGDC